MPILDRVDVHGRSAVFHAYVADKAHKRSRRLWRMVVGLAGLGAAGLAAYMIYDGLEDRSLVWWLALPVVGMAVFVEVNHRREANVLPVALAGHGLSDADKNALVKELDTLAEYAELREATSRAALSQFAENSALGGGGLNLRIGNDEPK